MRHVHLFRVWGCSRRLPGPESESSRSPERALRGTPGARRAPGGPAQGYRENIAVPPDKASFNKRLSVCLWHSESDFKFGKSTEIHLTQAPARDTPT